jgi:transposase InsO family protein
VISEEHKNVKGIYGTIRFKKHIENKLKIVLNNKLIRKQAAEEIKKYVHWYNNERIQKKLGYLSPVQYRLKYSN